MAVATSYNVNGTTLLLVFVFVFAISRISHAAAVPAIYVLGSSVVDVGNNNYLPLSRARADFPHNGIDYPNGISTGRFSNGKNIADFIAKKVGLPTSPPYLSLMGMTPPITGVSFASGGSGILNITGVNIVSISLAQQLEYFSMVRDKLIQQLGQSGAQMHLSQSIFTIFMGNNDISAYFTAGSAVSLDYTPQQYVDLMLSTFRGLLKMLYGLGARKMVVSGVGAMGCYPAQRKTDSMGKCIVKTNVLSARYNEGLKIMLHDLKSELLDMTYVYFDMYGAMINLFQNAQTYGFTDIKDACCGLGKLNADMPCSPRSNYCPNRENYVFWDSLHLTEVAASMIVDILYSGTLEYAVPINMSQLIDAGPNVEEQALLYLEA